MNKYSETLICLMLGFCGLCAPAAFAVSPPEFEVIGNTIHPGSRDWYQVQRQSDQVAVCEGTGPCLVPDGTYIVINLTRGERFGDVRVPASTPVGSTSGLIVYPEPGWYQVQDATTFDSICEGGTECRVSPGSYIVINHSTGDRYFESISEPIGGTGIPVDFGDFSLSGQTLAFQVADWLQVQDARTYDSVCEGVNISCTVAAGTYIVINHASGQRWDEIVVTGGDGTTSPTEPSPTTPVPTTPVPTTPGPIINASNYRALVKQALEVFSGQAYDDRVTLFPYFRNSVATGNSQGELFFDCFLPGGTYRQWLLSTPSSINSVEMNYNNCSWPGGYSAGREDRLNGSFADTFSPGGHRMNFIDFSAQLFANPPGSMMQVNGIYNTDCCGNGVVLNTENFDYFFTYPEGTLRVSNANTSLVRRSDVGLMRGQFTMQRADGLVDSATADLADVQVRTNRPFTWDAEGVADQGSERHQWKFNSGELTLTATDDGSSVQVSADTGDFNTVSVTISNATESRSFIENWGDWQEALYCTRGRCETFTVPGQAERQPAFF